MKRLILVFVILSVIITFGKTAITSAINTKRNQKIQDLRLQTKDLQIETTKLQLNELQKQIQEELNNGHTDKMRVKELERKLDDANKKIDQLEIEKQVRLKKKEDEAARLAAIQNTVTGSTKVSAASNKEAWLLAVGVPQADWGYMDYIISQESGWCHMKWQGTYGACPTSYIERFSPYNANVGYGLCQSTPAIKYASHGADWATNAVTQLKWCYSYALGYGSIAQAASFKKCLGSCYSSRTKTTVYKHTPWF